MIKDTAKIAVEANPTPEVENASTKINLGQVFSPSGEYLNELSLFAAYFNLIPNLITEIEINCKRANEWFENQYQAEITKKHFNKRYFNGSKKAELDKVFYFLFEDLVVCFDINNSKAKVLFSGTPAEKVESIIKEVKKFKKRVQRKPFITLLIKSSGPGFEYLSFPIVKPKLSIADNYNDDFEDTHKTILQRLQKSNDKGLVILHGKPGTGKTNYIRYLVSLIKKRVIILPLSRVSTITDPELIPLLTENPDSVFVIEDAENIVIDREEEGYSPVSSLLNISDGLLSDLLNIQIICTFNTDLSKVDKALMRKGRLIAKYEFKELEVEKAKRLSGKLGFQTEINSPMTLASIYNQEEKDFRQEQNNKSIGFKATNGNKFAETD
ncbi:AAA family ATPase [Echinicola marina]|uniref:AAA family ATPase n=1 Tax=Echinicola marina TaxID=2859768 RepID=UPI001CF6975F|nr:AAA family ATPase [Echinicola marina]UCS92494.1 AAA family ATPase [Echinicola marina]